MQVVSLRKATCTKGIRLPSFVGTKQVSLRKETYPFEGILALFQQRKEYGCASKGILFVSLLCSNNKQQKGYGCRNKRIFLVSLFCSNNKRDTDAQAKGYFLYPFFVLTAKKIRWLFFFMVIQLLRKANYFLFAKKGY